MNILSPPMHDTCIHRSQDKPGHARTWFHQILYYYQHYCQYCYPATGTLTRSMHHKVLLSWYQVLSTVGPFYDNMTWTMWNCRSLDVWFNTAFPFHTLGILHNDIYLPLNTGDSVSLLALFWPMGNVALSLLPSFFKLVQKIATIAGPANGKAPLPSHNQFVW